jgi:hypothetical protein
MGVGEFPPEFSPGLRLAGRYLLERPVGSGGMSHVWRAVDEVLGRPVAVKALATPLAADPVLRSVTQREARAAARIAHPNVTQVHDYGEARMAGGAVIGYLVMELLEGENLANRLLRGLLPWPDAVRVCADVAAALQAAHRLGVVHRDIKPSNVVLTATGAKVVDFGIAALGVGPEAGGRLVAGTPAYVAPELLGRGAPTPASDVYALGALLYETLTGRPRLNATTWAEAAHAQEHGLADAPLSVPGLPEVVRLLCERCLSGSPERRPASEEAAVILAAVAGRPSGHNSGGVGHGAFATVGPTLFDPATVPMVPRAEIPHWTEGAHVASAGRLGWVGRRPRPLGVALAAAVALLVGLLVVSAVTLLGGDDPQGAAGAGTPSQPAATTDVPTPASTPPTEEPATLEATLGAIEAQIASALDSGQIDNDMARDLADDLRDLRDRFERGRINDLQSRAERLRNRLEDRVQDNELDSAFAAQLDALLAQLVRLTGGND